MTNRFTMVLRHALIIAGTFAFGCLQLNAQWNQTPCPAGGAIQCMATIGNTVIAGTQTLGIYRSVDSGASWSQINSGLGNNNILSFAFNGSSSTLFAGTNGGGIYTSTNNGSTWSAASTGLTNQQVQALAVIGSTVFAGTLGGGIFWSTDNGGNWSSVSSFTMNQVIWCFATNGNTLYAGANGGQIYTTNDNGSTWTSISSGLPNQDVKAFASGINYLLAGVTNGGVFKSTNNGSSWSLSNSGISNLYPKTFLQSGGSICVGTVNDAFISNDNGSTWASMNTPSLDVWSMTIDASAVFLGTWNDGVWTRNNTQVFSGITEVNPNIEKLTLYPNPTSGVITINGAEGKTVSVYNILGEVIYSGKAENKKTEIDLTGKSNGIYFVKTGFLTQKIIKE